MITTTGSSLCRESSKSKVSGSGPQLNILAWVRCARAGVLTLRGGGAQVAVMNMLYLLASVAQLLALRVLVVVLSLWVLEDLCYKISVTRVREYGRCGCPWSAKTACCDHATSVPHQVAISHFAGRLPHNRVAINHFACRNKPFCIHFEVAISQWACRN